MLTILHPDILSVPANNGRVLIDAYGLAVTLDIESGSFICDELLSVCASARRQQHAPIDQRAYVGQS